MLEPLLEGARALPPAVWQTLVELGPSMLLGLALAGLLHVLVPPGLIERRLRPGTFRSVFEAVLVGVPLPLCSCGVVPAALGLRRAGASLGATTGFLISTPQTGVDSILVAAAFLGWPFALFKVGAAFVTGLLGGVLVNLLVREPSPQPAGQPAGPRPLSPLPSPPGGRLRRGLGYAVFDLLASIDLWLVAGVLISAVLTVALPPGSLSGAAWAQGFLGMLLMLLIALPMYVCSTGSVPIAASLIAAGMQPGAALVFLMAGPASNMATLGAVGKTLGGRVAAIYVATVAGSSLLLAWLFDFALAPVQGASAPAGHAHGAGPAVGEPSTDWLGTLAALVLSALLVLLIARRIARRLAARRVRTRPAGGSMALTLKVEGMTCQNCAAHVKRALEAVPGVTRASPDLETGLVTIEGRPEEPELLDRAVEQAGYRVARP